MSKDQNVALTRLEPRYRARVRNTTNNAESFQLHSLFGLSLSLQATLDLQAIIGTLARSGRPEFLSKILWHTGIPIFLWAQTSSFGSPENSLPTCNFFFSSETGCFAISNVFWNLKTIRKLKIFLR